MEEYCVYPSSEEEPVKDNHTGYGIALYRSGVCVRVIEDISPDRGSIRALAGLFNRERLDPIHLDQAVEDYLTDFRI